VAIISNNYLENINRYYILVNAKDAGVLPAVFPQASVTNNTIVGNGSYGGGQKGIWFNRGAWGTIANNIVSELDYTGVSIEPERASGIVTRFGYLNVQNRTLVYGNNVSASSSINNKGMYIQGHRDSVYGNSVSGFRWGIEIHSGGDAPVVPETTIVTNNTITGGVIGIIVASEGDAVGTRDSVVIGGSPAGKNTITGQSQPDGQAITMSFRSSDQQDDFSSPIPVDARYNDFGVYTSSQILQRIFERGDTTMPGHTLDTVLIDPFYSLKVAVSVKAFLQGPYNIAVGGDSMFNTLKTGDYLAGHFGSASFPALAVDSINIEIRTDDSAAASVTRKFAPAWLLTNGTIRAFADTTKDYVEFDTTTSYYHVVVRHRNHLAIMSKDSISLSATPTLYDFSTALSQAYGTNPMVGVGTRYGMWAGDTDTSGVVDVADRSTTWNERNQLGYRSADVDVSGVVDVADRSVVWNNRNKFTKVP
jgi:hypothetical protein